VEEVDGRGVIGTSAFGILLRRYRVAAGLSQEGLAERARMSPEGVGSLERGIRRTPQRRTLELLAQALGLNADEEREFEAAASRSALPRPVGMSNAARGSRQAAEMPHSNLPLLLSSFVGREAELRDISALVRDHRLVTLTGTGGIGKTRTALRVGGILADNADDGVWLIELAPVGDPLMVAAAIASALGVQEVHQRPLLQTLLAFLKNKRLLVILDNCEQVITGAAIVADTLLTGCPGLRILATSREPLRAAGEYTYRIPSMGMPPPGSSDRLGAPDVAAYGAIALFTERARAADHRFALTDENAPIVVELCRRLDGIPLAIELAAARAHTLSLHALSEKLDQRFRILTAGNRAAMPRHQTMRAAIDWSYDALPALEQRAFERLSIFSGGCTLAAAAAVCAPDANGEADVDVLELVSSLVDKSLVAADLERREPRYSLLESFRHYAREKLVARDERQIVARRHAVAYLDIAERLNRAYDTEYDGVWLAQARDEMDNWRAALEWSLGKRRDVSLGIRLAGALGPVWTRRAAVEGRRWIGMALQTAAAERATTPPAVVARLELADANIAMHLTLWKPMLASARRALELFQRVDDRRGTAEAQIIAGRALALLGRPQEAEAYLATALESCEALSIPRLTGTALESLAMARMTAGDIAGSRPLYHKAMSVFETVDAEQSMANVTSNLAGMEFRGGDAESALRLATDALSTHRALNDPRVALLLCNLAAYLIVLRRFDEARAYALEGLAVASERHMEVPVTWALQHLAAVAVFRPGHPERVGADRRRAARILGFVDARLAALETSRKYTEQQEYDSVVAALRETLGAQALTTLMTAGASMTEVRAIETALLN
jgi:predicted ATPase/DNA-binding XRE family transcriptional regulator